MSALCGSSGATSSSNGRLGRSSRPRPTPSALAAPTWRHGVRADRRAPDAPGGRRTRTRGETSGYCSAEPDLADFPQAGCECQWKRAEPCLELGELRSPRPRAGSGGSRATALAPRHSPPRARRRQDARHVCRRDRRPRRRPGQQRARQLAARAVNIAALHAEFRGPATVSPSSAARRRSW